MISFHNKSKALIIVLIMLAGFFLPSTASAQETVKIGVLAYRGHEEAIIRWHPTAEYLTAKISSHSFEIVPLDLNDIREAIRRKEVDFIITNPGNYVELEAGYGASRVATLKTIYNGRTLKEYGAVIFTKADRTDIKDLKDLKGKKFMATEKEGFGSWRVSWREFNDYGIDPFRDFLGIEFIGLPQDLVVYGVRDNKADAGTVRTGFLESMAAEGKINISDFRILNQRKHNDFPQLLSTRLYPEWAFAKAKDTLDELAEKVVIALIEMPQDSNAARAAKIVGWTVPLDYQRVHELMKELRITPYEDYGKITFVQALRKYWFWFALSFTGLFVIGAVTVYALRLRGEIIGRKKAENVLLRNERLLHLFVEHSPAAIAMFDRDMKYIAASRRFLIDYALSNQNIMGRSHYDVFPEIPERWKEIHRRCLAGATEKCDEDLFLRTDGGLDWVRWEIHPWYEYTEEIGGIIIFSEVITNRKKAEEELRIINEELSAINRIITTTTAAAGVQQILETVLDEALRIIGLEGGTICLVMPDETMQLAAHRETSDATIKDLTDNIVKIGDCLCGECARDLKPLILREREEVLKFATREATRGEDIRFHAAYPLIVGQKCLGVLCVFSRTDKKPAERSLKLLESVSAQIGIAVDNAQMFERISHHSAILEDKVKERTTELQNSQQALVNLLEDMNQKAFELAEANEKLKEIDRLKSIFIASMSHELRTPLNSIIGFSSILLNEWLGTLNPEQKENLAAILKSGKHLLALINDVIDISKIEAGVLDVRYVDFDLYGVILDAAKIFQKEAKNKGLEFNIVVPRQSMHTDKRRLLQCVTNLVSNAVKFTENGSVSIVARLIDDSNLIEISVEDTGIGIKHEDFPKLFKPFVRIENHLTLKVHGTGLGLYLTRKLATDVLKGDIIVKSAYEKGSNFTIRIPIKAVNSE